MTGLSPIDTVRAQSDQLAFLRPLAANELGALEFCQAQGFADAQAVADQRNAIARWPPAPADSPSTAPAEALGRTGKVWFGGDQTALTDQILSHRGKPLVGPDSATLAQYAESIGSSVRLVCKQAAYTAKLAEAQAHEPPHPSGVFPCLPGMIFGLPQFPAVTVEDLQDLRPNRR